MAFDFFKKESLDCSTEKNKITSDEEALNNPVSRRKVFGVFSGVVAGIFLTHRAEAGTWKKLAPTGNGLLGSSGVVKTDATGKLTAATAGTDYAKPDTTSSWSAKQNFTSIHETRVTMSAADINVAAGAVFTKTVSTNITFTVSNVPASGAVVSFILELTNPGSATVTWWSGVKWAAGTVPALTAAGVDILGFYTHDGGTTWRGMVLAKDSK